MTDTKISFIGGGNMAYAIIQGLGHESPFDIHISEPNAPRAKWLKANAPFATIHTDNARACQDASQVVLAVKPQVMDTVCTDLADQGVRPALGYVSIAAGIPCISLERWLGVTSDIIRAMPNQPALSKQSMTVLFANSGASKGAQDQAQQLLSAVGKTLWLADESLMDAATAVSGSGPGFLYQVFEHMVDSACQLGFTRAQANTLVRATALGASTVAANSEQSLSELRASVSSPGGTTEAGLKAMADANIRDIFLSALKAARDRGREISSASENDL